MTVRVLAFVEGATEETFVKTVLAELLQARGIDIRPTTPGIRRSQGGVQAWIKARADLIRYVKEDRARHVTTMFDYYGLPADWPGRMEARSVPYADRASTVERAIEDAVAGEVGHTFNPKYFLPYVQMHEFEALLFSDPATLAGVLPVPGAEDRLQAVASGFATPEEIDDSPTSAPSKRIRDICREYRKVVHGSIAAHRIGIEVMRAACPHFGQWIAKLEALR